MRSVHKLVLAGALACAWTAHAAAQAPAGDRDDQFVATGCVMAGGDVRSAEPLSILVWLGPSTRGRNVEFDVTVRTVDVEKVTVLGPCGGG